MTYYNPQGPYGGPPHTWVEKLLFWLLLTTFLVAIAWPDLVGWLG